MIFTSCPKCCSQYFKHIFMFPSRPDVVFLSRLPSSQFSTFYIVQYSERVFCVRCACGAYLLDVYMMLLLKVRCRAETQGRWLAGCCHNKGNEVFLAAVSLA